MNIGMIVIIAFIIMLFWCWSKSGETTCKVCGKRINLSDKNIQKHYGKAGYYGCLVDHALCEKCRQKWQ